MRSDVLALRRLSLVQRAVAKIELTTLTLAALLLAGILGSGNLQAQSPQDSFVLHHEGRTIVLQPYGAAVVRVTLSKDEPKAGYGIVAKPSLDGWRHAQDESGDDVFRSEQLVVR
jgi:hypothetical protein